MTKQRMQYNCTKLRKGKATRIRVLNNIDLAFWISFLYITPRSHSGNVLT